MNLLLASICLPRLRRNLSEIGQYSAECYRFRIASSQGEVHIAIVPVELLIDGGGFGVGVTCTQGQADRGLRFLDCFGSSSGEQREDARTQAGGNARGNKHRLIQY